MPGEIASGRKGQELIFYITNVSIVNCFCYIHVYIRGDVKISTYKPHTNHKKSSVSSHTLAPTTICDFSHSICRSPLTDLGHISSVTYVCHPLWFVCGPREGILTSPLKRKRAFAIYSSRYTSQAPFKFLSEIMYLLSKIESIILVQIVYVHHSAYTP